MGLFFYKLVSPYSEDVTKNCRLTVNEIDSNFLNLKDKNIKDVGFDCETNVITLTRNNGEKMSVDLSDAMSGVTKNFNVDFKEESDCKGTGTLTFNWDEDGAECEYSIKGLVTKDNIGNFVMTESITDGSVIGNGRDGNPLRLNVIEQTGQYKPVIDLIDTTIGETLPKKNDLGDRYLTLERVDDYGYLYNMDGVIEIANKLGNGWRIPTKDDWDNMLNAIEPCLYRDHESVKCYAELGKIAGKELKSVKEWSVDPSTSGISDDEYSHVDDDDNPDEKPINAAGVNKYGFGVLPGGYAYVKDQNNQEIGNFKKHGSFWTNTKVMGSDYFVKTFAYNMTGVWQGAQSPCDFRSLRLVKDYTGDNARKADYIAGKYYEEVLMPSLNTEHGFSIWTKTNIDVEVSKDNFVSYPDYCDTNAHNAYVINEWVGDAWERKIMPEGGVIIIVDEQTWHDTDKEGNITSTHYQKDTEYRLVNGKLVSTDDILYNRVSKAVDKLWGALNDEIDARKANDEFLSGAIETEIVKRMEGAIDDETARATYRENEIEDKIPQGGTYTISASTQEAIPSLGGENGIEDNQIILQFDGNFGEF